MYSFFFLRLSWAEIWKKVGGGGGTLVDIRTISEFRRTYLVLDLPSDFLEGLFLGFGERKPSWNWVTFGQEGAFLFLRQDERSRGAFLQGRKGKITVS